MPAFQSTLTTYSSPYKPATGLYIGAPIWQLTASSSGTGSSSAASNSIKAKSATGSAVGSSSATGVRIVPRNASSSAVGSFTIVISGPTQLRLGRLTDYSFPYLTGGRYYIGPAIYDRTATGAGTGTQSAVSLVRTARQATGSGSAGESTSTNLEILFRSATASGVGSTSGGASFYKFHMFRPPTAFDGPTTLVGGDRVANRLARFYRPRERGINVYKLVDSTFTQVDQSDYTNISKVYHGGHIHQLTEEEYADLLGAGYGAYLT
jgi:hypothetical protein